MRSIDDGPWAVQSVRVIAIALPMALGRDDEARRSDIGISQQGLPAEAKLRIRRYKYLSTYRPDPANVTTSE
jgi:hypothetical protein